MFVGCMIHQIDMLVCISSFVIPHSFMCSFFVSLLLYYHDWYRYFLFTLSCKCFIVKSLFLYPFLVVECFCRRRSQHVSLNSISIRVVFKPLKSCYTPSRKKISQAYLLPFNYSHAHPE